MAKISKKQALLIAHKVDPHLGLNSKAIIAPPIIKGSSEEWIVSNTYSDKGHTMEPRVYIDMNTGAIRRHMTIDLTQKEAIRKEQEERLRAMKQKMSSTPSWQVSPFGTKSGDMKWLLLTTGIFAFFAITASSSK